MTTYNLIQLNYVVQQIGKERHTNKTCKDMTHIDQHKTLCRSVDYRKNKSVGKIAGTKQDISIAEIIDK